VENHPNPQRGVAILGVCLRAAFGSQRNYAKSQSPQPVATGSPNSWNIYDLHGNVSEWTIAVESPDRLHEVWEELVAENFASLENSDLKRFFLAGGRCNTSFQTTPKDWPKFSIWGGFPLESELQRGNPAAERKPKPLPINEMASHLTDVLPGFRVLAERTLANDWLYVIRSSTVLNPHRPLVEIREELANHRKRIAELVQGTDGEIAEARVAYYESLAALRTGDKQQASNLLSQQAVVTEDPYTAMLSTLMELDRAR
jgi:ketosteroid isomerase-like protein